MGYYYGILVLIIGVSYGDQSAYPTSNVVAPLTQEYTDTGLVDNTAYYNQGDYTQGAYDYTQYSDTDRTAELIECPYHPHGYHCFPGCSSGRNHGSGCE